MDQSMQQSGGNPSDQSANPKKLFVGNLSWNLTSEDLRELFSEFGNVEDAIVLTDKFSGRSKGFGFVTMSSAEEAQAAINALNEKEVDGRAMVVNIAQPPRPREDRGGSRPGGFRGGFQQRSGGSSNGGSRGGSNFRRGGNRDY